jgi:hypothetical protein
MRRGKKVKGWQSGKDWKRNFKTRSKKTAVQQAITSWLIVKPQNHGENQNRPKSYPSLDTSNISAKHGWVPMEDPVEIKIRAHEWLCFYKYDYNTKRGLCCPFQHLCGTKSLPGIAGVRQHLLHEGIHPPVYKEMFKRVEEEYH